MPADSAPDLKRAILDRIASHAGRAWTPADFADVGPRTAVDKALQRLVAAGDLRRIERGVYDRPHQSSLTGRTAVPDYRAVIDGIARRDNIRVLIDGMTAANDLGLTTAVPAKIIAYVETRLRPIRLGNQEIRFRTSTPSRLLWANRPAMRIVQALHWLKDSLQDPIERSRLTDRLQRILADPEHGRAMREDLVAGFSALPIWMQEFLRPMLAEAAQPPKAKADTAGTARASKRRA
ncbi:DUF6088 family protein [Gemmatimonas sp.]|uniref:DUF6088 family protein n=1 Tax=Gemmatimonas sp. TaxID=1962908 RepID=UPI00333E8A4D